MLNESKYILVATLCLDDSFAHSWHSLNQLHEVVTSNAFQLTGVLCKTQILSSSVRLDGQRHCTTILRSLQRCSSPDSGWATQGHSETCPEATSVLALLYSWVWGSC